MRTTHGGPAYVSRAGLDEIRRGAEELLRDAADEEGYHAACAWAMRQLQDPLASHLPPLQAVAARERFHGRVSLGLTLRTQLLQCHAPADTLPQPRALSGLESLEGHGWRARLCGMLGCGWRRADLVSNVESGSAAAAAGLHVGDEIVEVCGHPIRGKTRRLALEILDEGPEGESVSLTLRRTPGLPGAPAGGGGSDAAASSATAVAPKLRTVRLRRTAVPLSTVTSRPLLCRSLPSSDVHLIGIRSFGSTTAAELRSTLRRIRHEHRAALADGGAGAGAPARRQPLLVFDLRGNEGGLLPQAISACRMVLPSGAHILSLCKAAPPRTVRTFRRRWYHKSELTPSGVPPGGDRDRGRVGDQATDLAAVDAVAMAREWPYVVLVSRSSASSAEVFAGALAHAGRALVIGERTYGKGSSQVTPRPPAPARTPARPALACPLPALACPSPALPCRRPCCAACAGTWPSLSCGDWLAAGGRVPIRRARNLVHGVHAGSRQRRALEATSLRWCDATRALALACGVTQLPRGGQRGGQRPCRSHRRAGRSSSPRGRGRVISEGGRNEARGHGAAAARRQCHLVSACPLVAARVHGGRAAAERLALRGFIRFCEAVCLRFDVW